MKKYKFIDYSFNTKKNLTMQNTISCLFICLSLFWSTSSQAQYKSNNQGVTIYEHINFMGRSQTLGVGRYRASELVFGDAELSAVKVPTGLRVIMYKDDYFKGFNLVLTSDAAYVGDDFNDVASSIIVEKVSQPLSFTKNQVVIYEHPNFKGKGQILEIDEYLEMSKYDVFAMSIGNNTLSSIQIPEGLKVTLYESFGFQGKKLELTSDSKYIGDAFNDKTSSIIIEKLTQKPSVPPTTTATTATPTLSSNIFVGCPSGQEEVPADNAAFEQEVLRLTNAERAKKGLPALTWDKDLARAARYHAADMFTDGYFDHNTHDKVNGREVMICRTFERIGKFGRGGAENIAINYSPEGTVKAWVNSPGHYSNMMGGYKKLGVGYYKDHWVQVFGF